MAEIDYGAVFGVSVDTGVTEQPAAEADTEETTAAESENIQEAAEPETEIPADDGVETEETDSKERNAQFAAARRKAEAERDRAISEVKANADRDRDALVKEIFEGLGQTDPYRKAPITTYAEYKAYMERHNTEAVNEELEEAGVSRRAIDAIVDAHPAVMAAKAATEQFRKQEEAAANAEMKAKVESQLKEIGEYDPNIKTLSDLTSLPKYDALKAYVGKGLNLTEAYRLSHYEEIAEKAAARARQQALNASASKGHMTPRAERGHGEESVPPEVIAEYRKLDPKATDKEIAKYWRNSR